MRHSSLASFGFVVLLVGFVWLAPSVVVQARQDSSRRWTAPRTADGHPDIQGTSQQSRMIPLDGRSHLAVGSRQWSGDSRGLWEGDTLVVETINLSPTGVAAAGSLSAQGDVEQAEAEWARALVAGDGPALDAIYAEDLVYVHSNGSVDTKQQWVGALTAGRIDFSAATQRDSRVRRYGDTAIVNALYDVVINTRPMTIQYLTVYVKADGRWRIVTQQTATLPAEDR